MFKGEEWQVVSETQWHKSDVHLIEVDLGLWILIMF